MSDERTGITCDDCFFRRAQLCALPGNTPCPTFRPADGALALARRLNAVAPAERKQPVPAAA